MGSPAPGGWPEFPEAIGFTIDRLAMHPHEADWWMHYFLVNGLIIGSGGFVGRPKKGVVEIGYEIAPGFRGTRLGLGAASALIEQAFDSGEVRSVIAHTLAVEGPSTKVLAAARVRRTRQRSRMRRATPCGGGGCQGGESPGGIRTLTG